MKKTREDKVVDAITVVLLVIVLIIIVIPFLAVLSSAFEDEEILLEKGMALIPTSPTLDTFAYIDRALGPWEQRPVFKTNIKRFISLRTVIAPIDINIVRKITDYFDEPTTKLPLNPSYEPTNNTKTEHKVIEPYSIKKNVAIFSDLQKLESVGLVVPDGTPHMYYAAMESKACKLTSVGQHYWRLVKENRI